MFDSRQHPILPRRRFVRRVVRNIGYGLGLIGGSLAIGILGYHQLAGLGWTDSYLNAAMILSGMGPVAELPTRTAKIFAGTYAIFSGIALISTAGVMFAPVLHRMLHRFHPADEGDKH